MKEHTHTKMSSLRYQKKMSSVFHHSIDWLLQVIKILKCMPHLFLSKNIIIEKPAGHIRKSAVRCRKVLFHFLSFWVLPSVTYLHYQITTVPRYLKGPWKDSALYPTYVSCYRPMSRLQDTSLTKKPPLSSYNCLLTSVASSLSVLQTCLTLSMTWHPESFWKCHF